MTTPATAAALAAAQDTATEQELVTAAQEGRAAGIEYAASGTRPACPYKLGTLTAHVWLRWLVHARLSAIGVPN